MICTLHPAAEQDLDRITTHYLKHFGREATERFVDEYERILNLVAGNPDLGTKTTKGRRCYPFRHVPYLMVYRAEANDITILVIRHQHRKPSVGAGRK